MSQIDWGKAPEGATHWEPGTYSPKGWMRLYNGDWFFWPVREAEVYRWVKTGVSDHRRAEFVERPSTEWNGTGLPPVGAVCELRTKTGGWGTAEIKYMSSTVCVWLWIRHDGGEQSVEWAEPPYRLEFRTIRTPEQIAADEREAEIEEIEELIAGYSYRHCAEQIYQAGYRKQSTKQDDQQ